ncbi:MAG: F0F1 ATP synthase subunit A [Thermoguttaceae bacterium]
MSANPVSHAQDAISFHLPHFLGGEVALPVIAGHQLTKFMVVEIAVAVLMMVIFIPLAQRIKGGALPKGRITNLFEVVLLFIRDMLIRPILHKKDAVLYTPFLWMLFFFIFFCNFLGLIPWSGSPTGSIAVTGVLATVSACVVIGTGIWHHGPVGFWLGMVPPMELPAAISFFLKPMLFVIEVFGLFIKNAVLAIRLWANMLAGHVVLAVFLSFIAMSAEQGALTFVAVTGASVAMSVAVSMLELLVAVLQAYIFTFITTLLISTSIHQH